MAAASADLSLEVEEDIGDKDFTPVRTYEELIMLNATKDFGKYDPTRLEVRWLATPSGMASCPPFSRGLEPGSAFLPACRSI